ncbi:unnamed protein product [Calypogeia fissa]
MNSCLWIRRALYVVGLPTSNLGSISSRSICSGSIGSKNTSSFSISWHRRLPSCSSSSFVDNGRSSSKVSSPIIDSLCFVPLLTADLSSLNPQFSSSWHYSRSLSWSSSSFVGKGHSSSKVLPPKVELLSSFSLLTADLSYLNPKPYSPLGLNPSLIDPRALGRFLGLSRVSSSSCSGSFYRSRRSFCRAGAEGGAMGDLGENPMRSFQILVAATRENGIGKDGALPWSLPSDMKFFKRITTQTASIGKKNAVVMGRSTWLSVPAKFRPLPGRLNVILSRTMSPEDVAAHGSDVMVCRSLHEALEVLTSPTNAAAIETVYVIGGGQVFGEAMTSPFCDAIHWTEIESEFDCDAFCPAVDSNLFAVWGSSAPAMENEIRYSFVTFVRRKGKNQSYVAELNGTSKANGKTDESTECIVGFLPEFIRHKHEEYQYLDLINDIVENGNVKGDRTGTGTISKFGCQMRFNLRKSFPLLTTKRVHFRGILEELLWFISGSTNAKILQDKDVKIWDGNSSKEYLDKLGLTDREEGDLGPIYGFQWRHFGAKYTNMHADYSGQGFDQLADVIHKIRTNPDDRRIMLSAWNPADLHLMALPPCHMFAQFYVANGELSCQMYQRSCDMGLGVPYNIASYSLLTCMIAHVCDLLPGDFVHVLGDAHVYKTHIEPLQIQLRNSPKPFPTLKIKSSAAKDIDSITANDFELIGYDSCKKIAMQMAV